MAVSDQVRAAYTSTGDAWERGPARVYDRMAELLVSRSPVPVEGAVVADVGAGTGAGGRAARRAGAARVVATDLAVGMLRADPDRPPAVVADARAIALRAGAVDIALAAFSLNHLAEPVLGLGEVARIVRPGGAVVVGAYASDDAHPVKEAVEEALRRHGWVPPVWMAWMKAEAVPQLATVESAARIATAAGLHGAAAAHHRIALDDLDAAAMVRWRLGMAQHAPFVAALSPAERVAVVDEAVARLGADPPPLVRSVIVLVATV